MTHTIRRSPANPALFQHQTLTLPARTLPSLPGFPAPVRVTPTLRYDDSCGNGHNTFAITAEVRSECGNYTSVGCCHEEITTAFPELIPLIPFHLTSSDGPMHYIANTLYHAGDRDAGGLRKGDPSHYALTLQVQLPGTWNFQYPLDLPRKFLSWVDKHRDILPDAEVIPLYHDRDPETYRPKYTIGGYPAARWHEAPFDSEHTALQFLALVSYYPFSVVSTPTAWSRGKERDFEAARSSAVWPQASEEVLSLPREELSTLLSERLPALIEEFLALLQEHGLEV